MAEVLGQRSLLGVGVLLAWLLLFHLLVNIWLLCLFTSLLVVLGGWLGSQAVLESNSVIHLERFITLEQIPPTAEDEHDLDQEIHHTVRKIVRDFVSSWYSTVSSQSGFEKQVEDAMISTAMELKLRARRVDRKKLSQRILELLGCHLQDHSSAKEPQTHPAVGTAPLWGRYFSVTGAHLALSSDVVEVNYMRAVVDLLLHALVPRPHLDTRSGRFVVGELITCNVMLPLVAKLSDPDWLNLLLIEIFSKTGRPSSPSSPDGAAAPPDGPHAAAINTHSKGAETPQKAEPRKSESLWEEPCVGSRTGSDEVDLSLGITDDECVKAVPGGDVHQQNDSYDLDSPPPDCKPSSVDSFVIIGRDDDLYERPRDCPSTQGLGSNGTEPDHDASPVDCSETRVPGPPRTDSCDSSSSVRTASSCVGELESKGGSSRELLLVGEQTGSSTELTAISPLQSCSSAGTFSFEPLSSPEGPVLIQNLRITGTITAKEHRGTGSHPYTLYTIKYETAMGSENAGSLQTSAEDAEATPTCLSPVQSVAFHTVNRRYSEFLNLQTRLEEKAELRKLSKGVKGPKKIFPDMPFWNMDSDKIETRKGLLETFLKQLCAIPEIANSEEMQEFLALNTDARIAFVKKPFIVSRIDKIVVNAIVDTLKTAFPRSEPQSPTEDEAEVDGRLVWDKKGKCRGKSSGKAVAVMNGADIRAPVLLGLGQTNSVFKGLTLAELEAAVSDQERLHTMELEPQSLTGPPRPAARPHGCSACEEEGAELGEVALNVLCLLMKEQWGFLCTHNIQKTIRLLFGTLVNRWLDVGVANLTSTRYWVTYLQVIQEAVWPGGVLPTQPAEERSPQQRHCSRQRALHCLMTLLPDVASDVLGSEKYKLSWETALDSFQDPVINRHLVYSLLDLLLDFLLPELPDQDFQRSLLKTLSRNPEKLLT